MYLVKIVRQTESAPVRLTVGPLMTKQAVTSMVFQPTDAVEVLARFGVIVATKSTEETTLTWAPGQ